MSGEVSIELSLDPVTKLLSCHMTNNCGRSLTLRRPVPPFDMKISGPPGTSPHYMTLGLFSVPKITIESGHQYTATFPLPGNIAFTVPGEYILKFNYRSLRSGGVGKTEGVDNVTAESNSVVFVVKPEDLPPRRSFPRGGASDKGSALSASAIAPSIEPPVQRRRAPKPKAGRARRP
jgi:hypothetical protein